ncbi:MAG TPA: penicillin-binding protein 2 [Planctomycetaceae bacterium]|nr:penicillin-binding protein 2 [Planctomycetaceae bacterium]
MNDVDQPAQTAATPRSSYRWRAVLVRFVMLTGWIILVGRLIQLQATQHAQLQVRVARQSVHREVLPARPGDILDRSGQALAMTIECESLFAVPAKISDPLRFAWQVSSILNLNTDELYNSLLQSREKQFLWIRRRLNEQQAEQIRNLDLPAGSWGLRTEFLRRYLHDGYAAHVIGLRDIDNRGQGGLEESLDQALRGVDGVRVFARDARGVLMDVDQQQSRPARAGRSVVSSIDLPLQIRTEQLLDELVQEWRPKGACAIVMEPWSGEVLSMASRPAFHPERLESVDERAWKNLAVSAVFEPGSTFKPMITGWALERGCLQRDEQIDCSYGVYRMGPRVLHDHHSYGRLSVTDVLVKSSNIGMAKIGEKLGLDQLYEGVRSFGFGRLTGIELPGELPGIVHPRADWTIYSLGSIPMGQELAVTPLQLLTAHAALANGGQLRRPTLLRRSLQPELATADTATVAAGEAVDSLLLSRETAEWLVREPMRQVVERGTAKAARLPGISLFGKTGTAQKLDPETGTYSDRAWVVSFVCGAPAEAPRVVVLVMVDEPTAPGIHYGGTVAAPTAARLTAIAEQRVAELGLPASTESTRISQKP